MIRFLICLLLVTFQITAFAQIRDPKSEEILPLTKPGELITKAGNFLNYSATYGLIYHENNPYTLPFITIVRNATQPWLVVLNGGPGRSNLRLSFPIDSLLNNYNIILPGYRGSDDRAIERAAMLSADSLQLFINKHKSVYNTNRIADDVALVINNYLHKPVSILSHSYGTMVAASFYKHYPNLVDTIFAFSPVNPHHPVPDPKKLRSSINYVADSLNISAQQIEDSLKLWLRLPNRKSLMLGLLASSYALSDLSMFCQGVFEQPDIRHNTAQKGQAFMQDTRLIDFALKFCNISVPASQNKNDIYKQISEIFFDHVTTYLTDNNCPEVSTFQADWPVRFFVPTYELFYAVEFPNTVKVSCNCGHAGLWRKAPSLLNPEWIK